MLTNEIVQAKHNAQLQKSENNDIITEELLRILGGIDTVLEHYLDGNSLNLAQLQQINQLITTPSPFSNKSSPQNMTVLRRNNNIKERNHQSHEMNILDNVMYSLCGGNTDKYYIIVTILTGRWCLLYWLIMIVLFMLIGFIARESYFDVAYRFFFDISWIIHCTLIFLLFNKKVFRLVLLTSFEFWLKIVYSIIFGIAWWWSATYEKKELMRIVNVFGVIASVLLVVLISAIDAVYTRRKIKICACVLLAVFFSYAMILTTISLFDEEKEKASRIYINGVPLSLLTIRSNTLRILTIFVCKQAVLIAIYPKRCVAVRTAYYVKWVDQENINNNNNNNSNNNDDGHTVERARICSVSKDVETQEVNYDDIKIEKVENRERNISTSK